MDLRNLYFDIYYKMNEIEIGNQDKRKWKK